MRTFDIVPVRNAHDLASIMALFKAYAAALRVDLAYQNFDAELAKLPGKYAPPRGEILLARKPDGTALGCVALRPLEGVGICEMKRLYITPEARGTGLGRRLIEEIVAAARIMGYREMRLDTLPDMTAAIARYRSAGFVSMPPYYDSPVAGTLFMRLRLD
jgi:ribosomal protein S18 acetylase RimI-like enzyme